MGALGLESLLEPRHAPRRCLLQAACSRRLPQPCPDAKKQNVGCEARVSARADVVEAANSESGENVSETCEEGAREKTSADGHITRAV